MREYKLNWRPDLSDLRDVPLRAVFRPPSKRPKTWNLVPGFSSVEDQLNEGSCTGQALAGVLEFLQIKAGVPFVDLSRQFAYYNARLLDGNTDYDAGSTIRTIVKAARRFGVCRESLWPYDVSTLSDKPLDKCYEEAEKHQVTAYQRLRNLDEIRDCIAMGLPVIFGFTVYEHVMSDEVAKTGVVRMPNKDESVLGGHAAVFAAYDDNREVLLWRNSWNKTWGMDGYGEIPYDYVRKKLASDFWVVQATESDLYAAYKINSGEAVA
jgi:C1A family cysteine protease